MSMTRLEKLFSSQNSRLLHENEIVPVQRAILFLYRQGAEQYLQHEITSNTGGSLPLEIKS